MEATGVPNVRVVYEPGHEETMPEEVTMPTLKYGKHPDCGYGWTLYYRQDDNERSDVETHFIRGDLDIDGVVKAAQEWLQTTGSSSST